MWDIILQLFVAVPFVVVIAAVAIDPVVNGDV